MRKLFTSGITGYKLHDFRHDALAALVVTAIAIPESLGFAVIVGLPPVTGLYTALLAPIVFG
ncbi:MAG: SulP family inorganic anion transporter, partial [Candidatus Saccharimonas sp.]